MSRRVPEVTFEIALRVNSADIGRTEILKGILLGMGMSEEEIIECEEWPYKCLSIYFHSQEKARGLRKKLKAFHLNDVTVLMRSLHKKDWQTKWKRDFKPFTLTKTFAVVPMWLKHKRPPHGKIPVFIDTSVAFGTGLHATTRFMAQFVDRCRGKYENFLDLGTGTGILAIIAAKCGVTDIKAIDISSEAVEVARVNCLENACAFIDLKAANAGSYRTKKQYDFVAANIITQDLITMGDKIISLVRPGKYLAVSGISLNSYAVFRKAYDRYPLRCVKIEKGEGWVAILYKRLE